MKLWTSRNTKAEIKGKKTQIKWEEAEDVGIKQYNSKTYDRKEIKVNRNRKDEQEGIQ